MNISRSILFGILVIGLALRLWAAFVVPPVEALNLIGDATAYDEIGRNIASGKGYAIGVPPVIRPTAQVAAPLYPMFLGCVYIAAGTGNHQAVRLIQCLIGVVLCWLVYVLGRTLVSERVGIVAAALAAVYPPFILHSYYGGPAYLLSENLSVPLVTLSLLLSARFAAAPHVRRALIVGIVVGLATLARATFLGFPAIIGLWIGYVRRSLREALITTIVIYVGMAVVLAPWVARNYRVIGRAEISTHGGMNFWYGNNHAARGGYVDLPLPASVVNGRTLDEVALNSLGYRAGLRALADNPSRIPFLVVRKILVLWLPFDDTRQWRPNIGFLIVIAAAAVGWWRLRRDPATWSLLILPALYLSFTSAAFFGDPRFRLPAEPALQVLSAAGLALRPSDR